LARPLPWLLRPKGRDCCWPRAVLANWPRWPRRALELGAAGVHSVHLDVCHRIAVQRTIDELPEEWAQIDVLVNNAGLSRGLDKLYTGKVDDWER